MPFKWCSGLPPFRLRRTSRRVEDRTNLTNLRATITAAQFYDWANDPDPTPPNGTNRGDNNDE